MIQRLAFFVAMACANAVSSHVGAQPIDVPQQSGGPEVVATVNGHEIFAAAVQRQLQRMPKALKDTSPRQLQAQALEALIQRELVLDGILQRYGERVEPLVEKQIAARRAKLSERGELLSTACHEAGISEAALRRAVAWSIAWPRYQQTYLTADRLQRYYREHKPHFDGGQRDVAHILFQFSENPSEEHRQEKFRAAREVLGKIRRDELSFADAAREYSEGPSGERGGELGAIRRQGPMSEAFTAAAFDLEPGRVSPPIVDHFGVHLIRCLKATAGETTFQQALPDVRRHAQRALFELLVDKRRKQAKVEYLANITPLSEWEQLQNRLARGILAAETEAVTTE